MTEPVTDEAQGVENTEQPNPHEVEDAAGEHYEQAENAESATTQTPARAGRPRPSDVRERDEQVFEYLGSSRDESGNLVAKTKAQIAEALKMEPKSVYLSLFRLSRDNRIHRGGPNGTSHAWTVGEKSTAQPVTAEAPATEAPVNETAQ